MSESIPIPSLIPLPDQAKNTAHDDNNEDVFATLFSPATPRASPTLGPVPDKQPKPVRHTRTETADSEFGSFVSVPSAEDPLHQLGQDFSPVPFTPLQDFEFLDKYTDAAKVATEKSKNNLLDELLQNELDPTSFLRAAPQDKELQDQSLLESEPDMLETMAITPMNSLSRAATPLQSKPFVSAHIAGDPRPVQHIHPPFVTTSAPVPHTSTTVPQDMQDQDQNLLDLDHALSETLEAHNNALSNPLPRTVALSQAQPLERSHVVGGKAASQQHVQRSQPPLMTPSTSLEPILSPEPRGSTSKLLDELVEHEDDPMYFVQQSSNDSSQAAAPNNDTSLLDLDPLEDENLERRSRHPARRSNWTEASSSVKIDRNPAHARSPSLPPSPTQLSAPEVQRTQSQSYFTPSSLVASSFPSRWMSSLLSRPAPPKAHEDVSGLPRAHGRAATVPGPSSITHGTPFGSQPYIAPSGAPGFAGDRTWDKGFQYHKDSVERVSLKLTGRKEVTVGVLTVPLADKLRPNLPALKRLARSWSLLYSLDEHGISLNTLYARCEAHLGGALLVLRDSNDAVFGGWMGEGIRQSKGSYYGSGESFLFRVLPDETLHIYKWTGKNDYVALCEPEYISFGGGDGHYGLYLDDTLSDGSSARCPTFENPPLCSPGPRQGENVTFECVGLEVWGVG